MPGISVGRDFVLVESDLDYYQILDTLGLLAAEKVCPIKALVWVLSDRMISIKFEELDELRMALSNLVGENGKGMRVAIVVPSSFYDSIIKIFLTIPPGFPFLCQTFSERSVALEWINV